MWVSKLFHAETAYGIKYFDDISVRRDTVEPSYRYFSDYMDSFLKLHYENGH